MSLLDFLLSQTNSDLAYRLYQEFSDLQVRVAAAEAKLGIGASHGTDPQAGQG